MARAENPFARDPRTSRLSAAESAHPFGYTPPEHNVFVPIRSFKVDLEDDEGPYDFTFAEDGPSTFTPEEEAFLAVTREEIAALKAEH